jgi:hypothetical protein
VRPELMQTFQGESLTLGSAGRLMLTWTCTEGLRNPAKPGGTPSEACHALAAAPPRTVRAAAESGLELMDAFLGCRFPSW